MKSTGAIVCISVVVLDVVAGILGIQGEMAQNEVRGVRYLVFECREPSNSAFRLGIAAACLLLLAHFIANIGGGCIFFVSRDDIQQSPLNKQVAVVCLLFSWTLLIVGFGLLVLGECPTQDRGNPAALLATTFWQSEVLCVLFMLLQVLHITWLPQP